MPNFRRSVKFHALGALTFWSASAVAQDAVPESAPEVRDFRLIPTIRPPAEQEPQIAPANRPPVVAVPAPPPVATETPAATDNTPSQAEQRPPARTAPPSARDTASPIAADAAPSRPAPEDGRGAASGNAEALPPLEVQIGPPSALPAEAANRPEARLPTDWSGWTLWAGLAAAIAAILAGVAFLRARARRAPEADTESKDRDLEQIALGRLLQADAAHKVSLADAAPPPPPPARPWIEIEFRPATVSATDQHALIEYELVLRNAGDGDAGNVRGSARIFNAGANQDEELAAFFAEPVEPVGAPRSIAAGGRAEFSQALLLPKEDMRPVEVQGRSLLIPLIAFNIRYEWGDGQTGQTALSFVVGREAQPPAEKMAPLRLDLGPRVYRQLAKRQHELKLVA